MRGVLARWGDPARGIPTLLDPVQAAEHHHMSRAPTPFEPSPPAPLWEGARGPGSRGGPGSWLSRTVGGLRVGVPQAGSPQLAGTPCLS